MSETKSTKKCPFCAEDIKNEAVFCKHCKNDLRKSEKLDEEKVIKTREVDKTSIVSLKGGLSSQELLIFNSEYEKKKKSNLVAYLLFLFFFGMLGSHQVYLNNKNKVKQYIGSIVIIIIGIASLSSQDYLIGGLFAFLCLVPTGFFLLYLCFGDLFTLGEQTKKVNEKSELEILLTLSK